MQMSATARPPGKGRLNVPVVALVIDGPDDRVRVESGVRVPLSRRPPERRHGTRGEVPEGGQALLLAVVQHDLAAVVRPRGPLPGFPAVEPEERGGGNG